MKIKRKSVTLIETLVGLAIITAMAGTTFLVSFSTVEKKKLESAVKKVQADLAWTRQMAVTNHQDYYVDFDTANNKYTIYKQSIAAANEVKRRSLDVNINRLDYFYDHSPDVYHTFTPTQLKFLSPSGTVVRGNDRPLNYGSNDDSYNATDFARVVLTQAGGEWAIIVYGGTGYLSIAALNPFRPRCFIATAAYGNHEEVRLLQVFRDKYLLTNAPGNALVSFYYLTSPAIAGYIEQREWAKKTMRVILKPALWSAKSLLRQSND